MLSSFLKITNQIYAGGQQMCCWGLHGNLCVCSWE